MEQEIKPVVTATSGPNKPILKGNEMNELTEIRSDVTAEINRHHGLAVARAGEAIQHVIAAGKLLLEVKAALPHGQFGEWMASNLQVSARQAQRYMAVAQGKAIPSRALGNQDRKNDTVSYLPHPSFIPSLGHWYSCAHDDGSLEFVIEPSSEHAGFFFVTHLDDEDGYTYNCTKRPIRADMVEITLSLMGLDHPSEAAWIIQKSNGVATAMDTFFAAH